MLQDLASEEHAISNLITFMKKLLSIFILAFIGNNSFSNGITLGSLSTNFNSTTNVTTVTFNLSWDNSWRSSVTNNWDAAWVFFKYDAGGVMHHLDLTGNDISVPSGFTYNVPSDKKGIMIYRDTFGSGNVNINNITVGVKSQWGTFDIRAYAIEMVYIPTGSFYVGDGASLFRLSNGSGGTRPPYQITGNYSSITFGSNSGQLFDGYILTSNALSNGYPTGYDSFYLMKYELTHGQYRGFLNSLSAEQQQTRISVSIASGIGAPIFATGSYRAAITEIATPGNASTGQKAIFGCDADNDNIYNESNDGENVAITNLSWMDGAAYLDWAGLRPMTELEYEKACRGPSTPVAGEFAWGSAGIFASAFTIQYANTDSERVSNTPTGGMAGWATTYATGPMRSGIFANATSGRFQSGAGYYGNMELTGNAGEMVTSVCYQSGKSFTGLSGNGNLHFSGNADVDFWPGINGNGSLTTSNTVYSGNNNGISSTAGYMVKGGAFAWYVTGNIDELQVSFRYPVQLSGGRYSVQTIRGARTIN